MLRFTLKTIIFLIPIIAVFAFPIAVFLLSREEYSMQTVVGMQIAHPDIVVGKAFSDLTSEFYYKKMLVAEKKPDIIAIGSSRTLEFRKEFFSNPDTFMNAAFGAANTDQMEKFIRELPANHAPRMVLLGLDQQVFKPDYSPAVLGDLATPDQVLADLFSYNWRVIYYDYAQRKFSFETLLKRHSKSDAIGLSALVEGNGYRGDGSRRYGTGLTEPTHKQELVSAADAAILALQKDRSSFQYGTDISPGALMSLDNTLALAQERHIIVVGFIPPYTPSIYKQMLSVNDPYRVSVFALPEAIREIFSKHGFQVYDFTDVSVVGGTSSEFVDIVHPTDKLDLRMLMYMAQHDPALSPYVDINKAQTLLKNTTGDFMPLDSQ